MAVFCINDDNVWSRLDLSLLQNSSVILYFNEEIFSEDTEWFRNNNYQLNIFDCLQWKNEVEMLNDLGKSLGFPEHFKGKSVDAFNDCLSEIEISEDGGRVLILHRFDAFAEIDPKAAWNLLDIITHNSWFFLLFGLRLLALVQSDNPRIEFNLLGTHAAMWNPREWLNEKRGL